MNMIRSEDFSLLQDAEAEPFRPGRHWSLWDMLKENAAAFMALGKTLHDFRMVFGWDTYHPIDAESGERRLKPEAIDDLQRHLQVLIEIARRLNLPVSAAVIQRHLPEIDKCPQTEREYNNIVGIFENELASKSFLFIPAHLNQYYESEEIVSDTVVNRFPSASVEIRDAATALACGLNTASVCSSMRAAEIGLKSLANDFPLKIKNDKPIHLAEWREVLDAMSNVARDIENRRNDDPTKEADQILSARRALNSVFSRTVGEFARLTRELPSMKHKRGKR